MRLFVVLVCFLPGVLIAQSRKEKKALEARQKADQVLIKEIQEHYTDLSAAYALNNISENKGGVKNYIVNYFARLNLLPYGSAGYEQPVTIDLGKQISSTSSLIINETPLSRFRIFSIGKFCQW